MTSGNPTFKSTLWEVGRDVSIAVFKDLAACVGTAGDTPIDETELCAERFDGVLEGFLDSFLNPESGEDVLGM